VDLHRDRWYPALRKRGLGKDKRDNAGMTIATAKLRIEATATGLRLRHGDAVLVEQVGHAEARPYLHPIRSPGQHILLTEDAPEHHPWQHGLYTGLNGVNGVGFWTEGLLGEPERRAADGQVRCVACATDVDGWLTRAKWRAPDGGLLLSDVMQWRARLHEQVLVLDLQWTLHAAADCRFDQYAYGGLFLRMPVHGAGDAALLTATGVRSQPEAEGQRARWVAVDLTGGPQRAGLAIIDHPGNDAEPAPWRVDGQLGIGPSPCIAGPWSLGTGASRRFRYRILAYDGAADAARINALVPTVEPS